MLVPALFAASEIKARSAEAGQSIDVLLFTDNGALTSAERQWIDARNIEVHGAIDTDGWKELVRDRRLSPSALVRLVLARHLADRYDKLLYIDADISVHAPVDALLALDTGDAPLAAAPSGRLFVNTATREKTEAHFKALGMTAPYRFFNSGVLLIDVKKWNRENLDERALAFIRRDPELCFLLDEHALNALLDGRFAPLSPIWNTRMFTWRSPLVRAMLDPVLIHYDGPNKPWKRFGRHRRLFEDRTGYRLYEDFIRDSPWPNWLDDQWTAYDLLRNVLEEGQGLSRYLRGRSRRPTRHEYADYIAAFVRDCREYPFADVEQGITSRQDGRLRLNRQAPSLDPIEAGRSRAA
jgi:lipopolysaccharide biosynthesis glycosyltransferase